VVLFALITAILVLPAKAFAATAASDNFNRANGSLGAGWTDMSDGGLAISNQMVVGNAAGTSGDIRTGESYANDQYSQVTVTATPLTGTQWIGPMVRAQNGGTALYVGIYFWNNGSPQLMVFKRINGAWTQLGSSYASGALAVGTTLTLTVVGSTLTFAQNGTTRVTASDTSLASGAPGIMANGAATADNWAGGTVVGTTSVGGTVSGLSSGAVVLQDNGGDNLSVAANGSFTFATLLAAGATYNVTVLTNPTGQTCTVANGVGTVGSANITNVAVTCSAGSGGRTGGSGSDTFNRPNGSLGPNWTDMSDGGLAISNQMVVGTNPNGTSGDVRTAETYANDQYSTITVTSTPLTGNQWIGPAVRVQNNGAGLYVGIYFWNGGSPLLELFERIGGTWTQLGNTFASGALPAGTKLTLTAIGNTVAFSENGTPEITVTDTSLASGAPAIIANGAATAANWSGGTATFQADYISTDATGIRTYDMLSANNGYGAQALRVLQPTHPAAGVAHNFLYVLPVEPGLGTTYGNGLATLQSADAQDQYNLTIIEPTFAYQPWYANSSSDPNIQYETFMTNELVPWVRANLSTTGTEQNWLIGFSKSGNGSQDLILKHPDLFNLAATWDFPADMSSYDQFGTVSSINYGSQANFAANYQLTSAFVNAHKTPFLTKNRIWLGGYSLYQQDVADYDTLLTSAGIQHTNGPSKYLAHRWDSGWMPQAVATLYKDSLH
jgi:hypothetical protein